MNVKLFIRIEVGCVSIYVVLHRHHLWLKRFSQTAKDKAYINYNPPKLKKNRNFRESDFAKFPKNFSHPKISGTCPKEMQWNFSKFWVASNFRGKNF